MKCKTISVGIRLFNSKVKIGGEVLLYLENTVKRSEKKHTPRFL